jgi:hypothetical protein
MLVLGFHRGMEITLRDMRTGQVFAVLRRSDRKSNKIAIQPSENCSVERKNCKSKKTLDVRRPSPV